MRLELRLQLTFADDEDARVVNSPVDVETAIARSVCGARILSAIFWNHGVSVWFACSCKIAGMPMRHAQRRPNVVAP